METTMRLLTYLELTRYTKPQLRALHRQMLGVLACYPKGSPEYETVMLNIHHIRLFIARRGMSLCFG